MAEWDALVITGATATGKTAIAVEAAERIGAEIISMDSRQVYRGMDIGTAKPTPEQRARVPHHGLDLIDPDERYGAGRFAVDARRWIQGIRERCRLPIMAGGTGFFLRALTNPLFAEPELERSARGRLHRYLAGLEPERLDRWLQELDPETTDILARRRGGGGRQRVERALEVALLTGRPMPWWHRNAPAREPPLRPLVCVLELPRYELYRRIDDRVAAMAANGLFDEVQDLLAAGFDAGDPGMNATGYIELIHVFRGEMSPESALDEVRRATRRYARRQLTWLRHQLPETAVRIDAARPPAEIAELIVQLATEEGL